MQNEQCGIQKGALLHCALCILYPWVLFGCAALPPNSFIDPTKVGQFGWKGEATEGGIRRILSARETPPGVANATEPTPEDLVVPYSDYRISPGDVLGLTVQGLLDSAAPFNAVLEVSALGEIRVPELGSVKISGLTEQEAELEIAARLRDSGLLARPVVIIVVQQKRGRTYNIVGAVRGAGVYPITSPDLRLLEAISMAGDADATVRKAYVIRRESEPVRYETPAARPAAPTAEEGWVIPPPIEEPAPKVPAEPLPPAGGLMSAAGVSYQENNRAAASQPPTKDELADILTPAAQSAPATQAGAPPQDFPPFVFDPQTGQVIEAEPNLPPIQAPPAESLPTREEFERPFEWEKVEDITLEQRVIAIDLVGLRNGDPRYNIVVRDRDVIHVPVDTGVFYIMGEVMRPGVYAFGGREITVKQAMAICGGFSPMAWPQRCELIRREPGTDKQTTRAINLDAIFAGLEEDFYLRDDDVLNVGTHFVAPFLFVIRNSFRFTYGFGFVYDRNFADKDAYSSRLNPEYVRQQQRAQRGLPF